MSDATLASMYADFGRWMSDADLGIGLDDRGFWMHIGVRVSPSAAARFIEGGVLDWLERRLAWFSDGLRSDGVRELVLSIGQIAYVVGHGPTRLHRLHAACRAAFEKDPNE